MDSRISEWKLYFLIARRKRNAEIFYWICPCLPQKSLVQCWSFFRPTAAEIKYGVSGFAESEGVFTSLFPEPKEGKRRQGDLKPPVSQFPYSLCTQYDLLMKIAYANQIEFFASKLRLRSMLLNHVCRCWIRSFREFNRSMRRIRGRQWLNKNT